MKRTLKDVLYTEFQQLTKTDVTRISVTTAHSWKLLKNCYIHFAQGLLGFQHPWSRSRKPSSSMSASELGTKGNAIWFLRLQFSQ